jgi:glycosyltransferase involved in cell wall biosynthesis
MHSIRKDKTITFISPLGMSLLKRPPVAGSGGAERQFFLFGKGLEKRGWSVCYITDNIKSKGNTETIMPVEVANFAFMRGGGKGRMLLDWITIIRAMWKANSNYYVIKTPAYLLVPMSLFTKLFRRRLVFWAQMDFDAYPELRPPGRLLGIFLDLGIRLADIILAQNKRQVEGFKMNYGRLARLIPNISGDLCMEDQPDADANSAYVKRIDILWVGNSMAKKRYEVVVALAKMLPDRSFAVAMNKADSMRYEEAEKLCGDIDNIRFLGEVNPIDMESWYGKAKMLLNTSTQEGFPNTYLQAWQNGVPVISICIDPDDLVSNAKLGVILGKKLTGLSDSEMEEYAEKLKPRIIKLLSDDVLYDELSDNARSYVTKNHSDSVLVGTLERILQEN